MNKGMKIPLLILYLFFLPVNLWSQQQQPLYNQKGNDFIFSEDKQIDSLKDKFIVANSDTLRITILENLGLLYERVNRDSSLKYGLASLELARKIGNVYREARALAGLSGVLREQGKFAEALDVLFAALKIAEDNNIPREVARCHRRLGAVYRELENYPKALEYCLMALKEDEAINNSNSAILDHMDLGHLYERLDQLDSALFHSEIAFKQMSVKDNFRPILLLILGNIYFKKEDYPMSSSFYHVGLEICAETNNFGTASRICRDLAQMFLKFNQKDSAFYYASLGFESGQKSSYQKGIIHNAIILAGLYESKEPALALKYYKLANDAKDSLFGPANIETLQNLLSREETRRNELETAKTSFKNKLRFYGLLSCSLITLIVAVILFRNNRIKKRANALLFEQKEEIRSALTQLKTTQSQLIQSEKMASLGELTAGIAHEIQNPLNFVNNFSEVNKELIDELQLELKAGKIEDAIDISNNIRDNEEKIGHHGKRADAIVKGMLQHSRTTSGEKQPTDINALADEYLRLAYQGLRAKDKDFTATLKTGFDPSNGKINIIPQDIGRVILNLINNAFYAVNEKKKVAPPDYEPTVWLQTKRTMEKVEISVRDNGNGMPEKIKEKIFQPFFTTKPTGKGTGLGLSLSYDIVKAHGGELRVEAKEGTGSEFIIILPAN